MLRPTGRLEDLVGDLSDVASVGVDREVRAVVAGELGGQLSRAGRQLRDALAALAAAPYDAAAQLVTAGLEPAQDGLGVRDGLSYASRCFRVSITPSTIRQLEPAAW